MRGHAEVARFGRLRAHFLKKGISRINGLDTNDAPSRVSVLTVDVPFPLGNVIGGSTLRARAYVRYAQAQSESGGQESNG